MLWSASSLLDQPAFDETYQPSCRKGYDKIEKRDRRQDLQRPSCAIGDCLAYIHEIYHSDCRNERAFLKQTNAIGEEIRNREANRLREDDVADSLEG